MTNSEIPPMTESENKSDNIKSNDDKPNDGSLETVPAAPEQPEELARSVDAVEADSEISSQELDNWSEASQDSADSNANADTKSNSQSVPNKAEAKLNEAFELLESMESEVVAKSGSTDQKPDADSKIADEIDSKLKAEPDLFADSWLDEPKPIAQPDGADLSSNTKTKPEIHSLQQQKEQLQQDIATLQQQKEQMLRSQVQEVQVSISKIIEEGTKELKERKAVLQVEIEKLERRQERINQEMRRNFAGSSQELAVRVQGFKNYLVGSLQDLVTAADKLELSRPDSPPRSRDRDRDKARAREMRDGDNYPREDARTRSRGERDTGRDRVRGDRPRAEREGSRGRERGSRDRDRERNIERSNRSDRTERGRGSRGNLAGQGRQPQFSEPSFADQSRQIRKLLDQYSKNPDYYGPPWQLRRTFEAKHAKKVQDWFFSQGGRGTVDSMGSRLQNILVASAAISVLHNLYDDRCRVLVLTDTPENLGEWRRGLQDCLGISRSSFGTNRGVVLFDTPEILVQRAERLIQEKLLPIIIVDETEELLNLSVLKFPVWLAFASGNKSVSSNYLY